MRRRSFIKLSAAAVVGTAATAGVQGRTAADNDISELVAYSTSSLVDEDGRALTDESSVAVWAADSATNEDMDGDDDYWWYEDETQIPLVAVDDNVVGFGSTLVDDENDLPADNAAFVENVWSAKLADDATVLWDEGHGTYWDLDKFSEFESRVEDAGFSLESTYDIEDDLDGADAIVITTPQWPYWGSDLYELESFVDDGGVVFLVNQSDYQDYDETWNLNYICDWLDLSFQFNDDQVEDSESNDGRDYQPTTSNFNTEFPFFGDDDDDDGDEENTAPSCSIASPADGNTVADTVTVQVSASDEEDDDTSLDVEVAIDGGSFQSASYDGSSGDYEYDWDTTGVDDGDYTIDARTTDSDGATTGASQVGVTVDNSGDGGDEPEGQVADLLEVDDGDTIRVEVDGTEERVRILGHDTPETRQNQDAELPEEWEGIESLDTLGTWGENASEFAKSELSVDSVILQYDDEEPKRDPFDRLLAYVYYDATGDGTRDDFYNLKTVEEGYARVYDSSFTKHDAFIEAEQAARDAGRGLWAESDPDQSSEIRNDSVAELYFPGASGIETSSGALSQSRAPVFAESSASWSGPTDGQRAPLVGVDESASVAMVGAPIVDESYESEEGFGVDTSGYENFVFLTNLLDSLSDTDGDVLIEGGHGQFNADYALSAEDAAYYQRFLEGVDIGFEQVNTLEASNLDGRALIVTSPVSTFSSEEKDALQTFVDEGGSVVLVGSGNAPADAQDNLNDLASALGTDLRLGSGTVTDYQNNLDNDDSIVTTTQFNSSFSLYDPY